MPVDTFEGGRVPPASTGEPTAFRGETFGSCLTLGNLMDAAWKCARGTDWKGRVQAFMLRAPTECRKLHRELHSGTYRMSPAARFTVMERGKPREVKSVAFRDRVVQRCLCDRVLVPAIEAHISPDSSACLKGRGLTAAYGAVLSMLREAPDGAWVLQFDFSGYFASIDRDEVKAMLPSLVADERLVSLLRLIVDNDERGLELGSHVSQLLAAWYPTAIDVAMRSLPGCVGYHRYMDDGVAVFRTRGECESALWELAEMCEGVGLSLNPAKTHANRASAPFSFCKARFTKGRKRSRMNVTKRQSRRCVRHLKAVRRLAERFDVDVGSAEASALGYLNRGRADLTRLVDGR